MLPGLVSRAVQAPTVHSGSPSDQLPWHHCSGTCDPSSLMGQEELLIITESHVVIKNSFGVFVGKVGVMTSKLLTCQKYITFLVGVSACSPLGHRRTGFLSVGPASRHLADLPCWGGGVFLPPSPTNPPIPETRPCSSSLLLPPLLLWAEESGVCPGRRPDLGGPWLA